MQRALQHVITSLQQLQRQCRGSAGRVAGTGVIILATADGARVVEPPKPVPANGYTCGPKYDVDLLLDQVATQFAPRFGVLLTDGSECTGWTLTTLADARRAFTPTSQAAGRTRRGGSSAARIARIRDDQEACFEKRAAEAAVAAWLDSTAQPTVAGVVVAGPAASKAAVAALLPPALWLRCLPLVTIPDTNLRTAWLASEGARSTAVDKHSPATALLAQVEHLKVTQPDLLVWGAHELRLACRAGVLKQAVVRDPDVYADLVDATPGDVFVQGVGHCELDVGILHYQCGSVRDLDA